MKVQLYSLYDTKGLMYLQPFIAINPLVAKRMVAHHATPDSLLKTNPTDFILFTVGTFDEQTGTVEAITPINHGPLEPPQ